MNPCFSSFSSASIVSSCAPELVSSSQHPVALITGASSGIGMALAKQLAEQGYHLILMARRAKLLEDWAQFITTQHPNCRVEVVTSDVAQFASHMSDIKKAAEASGRLDLVIANAGVGIVTSEWNNTWVTTQHTLHVNLLGAIATLEAAKDVMLAQGHGHLVAISSMAALRGTAQTSAYCASKAGLATFLESLRIDVWRKNITVLSVHPGFVDTPMTRQNGYMPWLVEPEQAAKLIIRAINKKRARLYFPWQMAVLAYLARVVPNRFYDWVSRLMQKKVQVFKEKRETTVVN